MSCRFFSSAASFSRVSDISARRNVGKRGDGGRQKPGRDFDTLRMPPRQLCLVDGCITGAKIGKFCAVHDPAAIAARVTAGMSEATKRKLMGCRA